MALVADYSAQHGRNGRGDSTSVYMTSSIGHSLSLPPFLLSAGNNNGRNSLGGNLYALSDRGGGREGRERDHDSRRIAKHASPLDPHYGLNPPNAINKTVGAEAILLHSLARC